MRRIQPNIYPFLSVVPLAMGFLILLLRRESRSCLWTEDWKWDIRHPLKMPHQDCIACT